MPYDGPQHDPVATRGRLMELKRQGEKLFDGRQGLLAYWEELRRNFYPERESFMGGLDFGADFAADLMTSYPLVVRRDLGNTFSSMLRRDKWFKIRGRRPDKEDTQARQYLDAFTEFQFNAMYDSDASFVRATREADHDFVTFGQCVTQIELYRPADGAVPHLLYRCRHLRDVAWCEGVTGKVDTIYRREKVPAITLTRMFPGKCHQKVLDLLKGSNPTPYHDINVWHCVIPSFLYAQMPGGKKMKQPYVSIYFDVDNEHELECVGSWTKGYNVARWQTVSGSQYAHSAAMVAMLPDARLLQAVTLVLLEAGEKAANPPVVATEEAIRSDIALYAGGTTWVDRDYDERLGEALRPLSQDKTGLQFALELVRDIRGSLRDAAFLNKLDMPPVGGPEMTAYEVGQRVQEWIRNALPLFEPVEGEYSGGICEDTFTILFQNSPEFQNALPESLAGETTQFEFESPLRAAADKAKAGRYLEAGGILREAAQLDPSVTLILDAPKATRDVLLGTVPANWLRQESDVEQMMAKQAAEAQQQKMMAMMQQGAEVAKTGSEAAANLGAAMPGLGMQ